jgi:hypothetical protein
MFSMARAPEPARITDASTKLFCFQTLGAISRRLSNTALHLWDLALQKAQKG